MFVEAIITQPPIEAFNKAVLHWSPQCYIYPSTLRSSCHFKIAFEVSSIPLSLAANAWIAPPLVDNLKLSGNMGTRQVGIHNRCHAFLAEVINEVRILNRLPSTKLFKTRSELPFPGWYL